MLVNIIKIALNPFGFLLKIAFVMLIVLYIACGVYFKTFDPQKMGDMIGTRIGQFVGARAEDFIESGDPAGWDGPTQEDMEDAAFEAEQKAWEADNK